MRSKSQVSLYILPDLIEEIDAMAYKPSAKKRAEMIERYREEECKRRSPASWVPACAMINEYLLQALWRTRGRRT